MAVTLVVSVDTEEEFDWSAPVSPEQRSVRHVIYLPRLQELFESLGVRPSYLVDYPIATTEEAVTTLGRFLHKGTCEIGTHIHPWVNPPIVEEICPRNTYLSNLPLSLQQDKLAVLTQSIREAFGVSPTSFKAGRYGLDFALVPVLQELGYKLDSSIIAFTSFVKDGGPSFEKIGPEPFLFEPPLVEETNGYEPLLEIPCTVGFNRRAFHWWASIHQTLAQDRYRWLHPIGALWHLRILRKIVLSPELSALPDLVNLLHAMGERHDVVLNLTLHSPSVQAGNTPFVRTDLELQEFWSRLRGALEFAIHHLGARCLTLSEYERQFRKKEVS